MPTRKLIGGSKKTKKYCAPGKKKYSFTCFNKKSLLKIAKAWNKENPKNKVQIKNKTAKQLWYDIDARLKHKCNNEMCWTCQNFINDKELS